MTRTSAATTHHMKAAHAKLKKAAVAAKKTAKK
jgi:hypothetical protein